MFFGKRSFVEQHGPYFLLRQRIERDGEIDEILRSHKKVNLALCNNTESPRRYDDP